MWKTVVTHRLKKLKYLRTVEKLTAWRRCHGFHRCDVHDGQWFHSSLPPTPEETTVSMLADVKTLKKETSLSGKERSWQRIQNFLNELEGGAASLTDEGFTRFKRIMKRRGRAAAHVLIAPSGTAQPSNSRPRCSAISFDVSVCMGEIIEGKMDPERGELEASLAGVGLLKHPDSSVSRTGRLNESLSTAVCSSTGVRIRRKPLFPSKTLLSGRKPIAKFQHRLPHQKLFVKR